MAAHNSKFKILRRKTPQIIAATIIIILTVYISFELLEDVFVEGTSLTSGPLVNTIMSFTRDVKNTDSFMGVLRDFWLNGS